MEQENINQIDYFEALLKSRRYSNSTIKTYTEAIKVFLKYFEDRDPAEISNKDFILFNSNFILKNGIPDFLREKKVSWKLSPRELLLKVEKEQQNY